MLLILIYLVINLHQLYMQFCDNTFSNKFKKLLFYLCKLSENLKRTTPQLILIYG